MWVHLIQTKVMFFYCKLGYSGPQSMLWAGIPSSINSNLASRNPSSNPGPGSEIFL